MVIVSKQLVAPNTNVQDEAGYCLRFTTSVFGAPRYNPTAWSAWLETKFKHGTNETFPEVAVPVWFEHWGDYDGSGQQKNWGHVVTRIPSRGYLSSPGSGYGQLWLDSLGAVERYFNCKYVGWSEDINGLRVAEVGDEMNDEQNNALMSVYKATFLGGGDAGPKSIIQRLTDIENKIDNGTASGGLSEADVLRLIKSVTYKAE